MVMMLQIDYRFFVVVVFVFFFASKSLLLEWGTKKGFIIFYKIIQIVRTLWLAIKPFYMSVCKHGFRSSFISYFISYLFDKVETSQPRVVVSYAYLVFSQPPVCLHQAM